MWVEFLINKFIVARPNAYYQIQMAKTHLVQQCISISLARYPNLQLYC